MKTIAALLVGAMALGGCAALKKADSPVTMRLSPSFAGGQASGALAESVAVAPVQARGVTSAMRYAYVDAAAPGEIHQAATFFWEEPPPRVLERALVAGLKTRFATVTGASLAVPADRRVAATLTRFEEIGAGGDARAVVGFDAVFVKAGKVTGGGSFCATAPIADATATVRAQAFEHAITGAVDGLVDTMAQATASAAPAGC